MRTSRLSCMCKTKTRSRGSGQTREVRRNLRHSPVVSHKVQGLRSDEAMLDQSVQGRLYVEWVAACQADELRVSRNPVVWSIYIAGIDSNIHGIKVLHLCPPVTQQSVKRKEKQRPGSLLKTSNWILPVQQTSVKPRQGNP
jgi:hypothetical protein